jgi:L-alanine-DL-glutamate epimerase-like enolase superfamily enzyme
MACWDLLGQTAGLPVATLMGGHVGESVALYRAISQDTPAKMAASVRKYRREGYRKFQLKVGGDPDVDIARIHAAADVLSPGDVLVADANTGWTQHAALRVAAAVADVNVYLEQPCPSYEQCRVVRAHTNRRSCSMKSSTASTWWRGRPATTPPMSSTSRSRRSAASRKRGRSATCACRSAWR